MKAIIDLAKRGTAHETALTQLAAAERGVEPDYHLHFESARTLFAELTPARLELLDTLKRIGASSIYALARAAQRNYSNVHTDTAALERLGLIERDENDAVFVPFDAVEIRLVLSTAA
jgi:predicted transcriptional regulator